MFQYVKRLQDEEAHIAFLLWWNRVVPLRSYVHGWKIGRALHEPGPGTVWLSPPQCGACTDHPPEVDKRAEAQSK